jgi:hypothetical protein
MNYISMNSSDDIIEHHGVKGMKWGRRMANRVKSWMDKENDKYYNSHKGYDDWGKAYDRQSELTKIGMDYHYKKAQKAYNDYINK